VGANIRANEHTKLMLGQYYEPHQLNVEPNAPGYTLPLDMNDIINYNNIKRTIPMDLVSNLIHKNGFVIGHFDFAASMAQSRQHHDVL